MSNPPPGWTCPPTLFDSNDGCDCECGVDDPDCDKPSQEQSTCFLPGEKCIDTVCVKPPTPFPTTSAPTISPFVDVGGDPGTQGSNSLDLESIILPLVGVAAVLVGIILAAVSSRTKKRRSLRMNHPGFNNQPMGNDGNGPQMFHTGENHVAGGFSNQGYNHHGGFWGNARHSFRAVAMAPWSMWNNSPNQNNFQGQPMNNGDGQMNGNRSGPGFWGNARNSFRAPWSRRNNNAAGISPNDPNQNNYQREPMNNGNGQMGNGPSLPPQGFWGNARNSFRAPWSRRNNDAAGFPPNQPNESGNQNNYEGSPPSNTNGSMGNANRGNNGNEQMGNGGNRPPQGFWGNARNSFRAPWSRKHNNASPAFSPNQSNDNNENNESANQGPTPPNNNTNEPMEEDPPFRTAISFWGNARNSFRAPWLSKNKSPFISNQPNSNDQPPNGGTPVKSSNESRKNAKPKPPAVSSQPKKSGTSIGGSASKSLKVSGNVPWSKRNNLPSVLSSDNGDNISQMTFASAPKQNAMDFWKNNEKNKASGNQPDFNKNTQNMQKLL